MIFVTVGTQVPFDRLIKTVDAWAGKHGRKDVFAQIGPSTYAPEHIESDRFITPDEFRRRVNEASILIAHAGMGSIITALELGKPVLVMPRRADLHEHRNDHQLATARRFLAQGRISVAFDEHELMAKLEAIDEIAPAERIATTASPQLIEALRRYIHDGALPAARGPRTCDGVICFGGEDWWYHNRGHYDMQMMRELSVHVPVLYVNSIGMRMPKIGEGKMFLKRVVRKLKSYSRGLKVIRPNFAVLSPTSIPRLRGTKFDRWMLSRQVRRAAARLGMRSPLIWINCPPGAETLDHVPHGALVYQRTDRYEAFPDVNQPLIKSYDDRLKAEADVTLFCSSLLYNEEQEQCARSLFVDHGVDYDRFAEAALKPAEPADVKDLPRPRVGFVGGIDRHTFDPEMFVEIVRAMPEQTFVMVGGCTLPQGWCPFPNVHFLGQRPYDQVADYMAACDVLIMPWNKSEWIKACNPVKLKEYLAVGRPVVTTPFDELQRYDGYTTPANSAEEFVAAIRAALATTCDVERLRTRVRQETWTAKANLVLANLEACGVLLARKAPGVGSAAVEAPALHQT